MMDAFIFDVDGTLWDSTDAAAIAWRRIAAGDGLSPEPITGERLKKEFGRLIDDIVLSLYPSMPLAKVHDFAVRCSLETNRSVKELNIPLYKGVETLFRELSLTAPVFIVSNCEVGYIEALLETTGLGPFVTDHLCPGDTGCAKAENIRRIAERHHLKNPAYIGDTMGDYIASKEAGLPFIYASYGFGDVPQPDFRIDAPLDLLKLI